MVYRIHFTGQDLARTRVVEAPSALMQLTTAARALRDRAQPVWLDPWRRSVGGLSGRARMVLSLIPPVGHSCTFVGGSHVGPLGELLELVRAAPVRQIRAELAVTIAEARLGVWAWRLLGDPALLDRLSAGLRDLHAGLLAPCWDQVTTAFAADRSMRMRHLAAGGVERLLTRLNPQWVRWSPPVLEVRMINGAERDVHLEGQGLLLIPSMFATRCLVITDGEQPALLYPAEPGEHARRVLAHSAERGTSAAVAALLGHSRAAVLETIAGHPGCTTTELATLAGLSPASASQHATVLREAGLVRTVRHRNTALHSPTDLGTALLNGAVAAQVG